MEPDELIDKLGGTTAVAKILNIRPPSVHAWRAGAIPADKLIRLAQVAESRGIATRRELLPDICEEVWPELVESPATEQ